MTDTLSVHTLIERVDTMDPGELDRLQAAINRRRGELARQGEAPTDGSSGIVIERRAYGSGVLQLERRGGDAPCWYFHLRKDGEQKTVYIGTTEEPEIMLAQIKGGIGG